jgi:ATP-dependent DNA helicase RecG
MGDGVKHERQGRGNRRAKDFCPDARPDSRYVPVRNSDGKDDFVLLIRVPYREDKVVRSISGKAYIRNGDEIRELTEEEIRELQIDKRELDFEREPVLDLKWPGDFDKDTVRAFCESVRTKWNLTGDQTDEQILEHRRLGKIVNGAFIPNTACTLVFALDPLEKFPGCAIRFLRYDGEFEGTERATMWRKT